jgi:uncharacterized protein (TIGR03435 family)
MTSSVYRAMQLSAAVVATLAMPIALGELTAQAPSAQTGSVAFEVVSIKRNTSAGPSRARLEPGRFTAVNAPVSQILRQAYDIQPFQLFNAPDWINSERYDVLAKAPEGVDVGRALAPLLRSLLNDRFAFRSHTESREMPVYELVPARKDGRLGEKLQQSPVDCTAFAAGQAPPPSPQSDEPPCAVMGTPGRYQMRGFPISRLAQILGSPLNRFVVDKTGLTGTWNLKLEFTPDHMPNLPPGAPPPGVTLPSPDAPSLFTAVQEQLGLKLEPARGPVTVLVIDRIERPSED